MRTYRIFSGPEEAAAVLAGELQTLSLVEKRSHVVLSGGSTPRLWFALMAQPPFAGAINWQNLHFWWGDERCVAAADVESNYGQAEQLLFRHVPIPAANVHRIRGENEPEAEALRLADEIKDVVPLQQGRPVFDWILLGMGTDGHTASLFPGQTNFDEKRLAVVASHPQTGQKRISLSAPQLASCRRLSFLVLGADKAVRVGEIFSQPDKELPYPAARISSSFGQTEWFLDRPAARLLNDMEP
ncbi:MAG: 6-phosphogluconolactonase [Desulfobulbaceae bacterium]|nr:6-phosphogluconolactonase [Desulfobulbaceae bacterium]